MHQVKRNIVPADAARGILKKKTVKAQPTTAKSTAINTAHQWRWHNPVDETYNTLRYENNGVCKNIGKTFGEVVPHFIIGIYQACLMADATGYCHIYVSATKK